MILASNLIREYTMKIIFSMAILLALATISPTYAEEEHGEHEEEESGLEFDSSAREAAGIVIERIESHSLKEAIKVPAEIMLNSYTTSNVSPRITAQVLARHARLGDGVKIGDSLVTLSSVAMAEASGELIVSAREWQRVKKLGKGAVSEKRYTEAQVAEQLALSRVLAYGMSQQQASKLINSGDARLAIGEFDLLAPQAGTILQDEFILGELIEPGRALFTISDESTLWVEAKTYSTQLQSVEIGDPAQVSVDGSNWVIGKIIQVHHRLDEKTRTQGIRIELANENDEFHPGQFAEAEIRTGNSKPVISVPSSAITIINGSPTVFKLENEHEFHPEAVETGVTVGGQTVIIHGLEAGELVAVEGVFYLKSMMLKSTLGEGHGH